MGLGTMELWERKVPKTQFNFVLYICKQNNFKTNLTNTYTFFLIDAIKQRLNPSACTEQMLQDTSLRNEGMKVDR